MEKFLVIICLLYPHEWIIILIGGIISAVIPLFIYTIKPCLKILEPQFVINANHLKISVKNQSFCSKAINLKIEACFITPNENGVANTYHLKLDFDEFLILPCQDIRDFKSHAVTQSTLDTLMIINPALNNANVEIIFNELIAELQNNEDMFIRIRAYAQHEFSGFGKAYERKFKYNAARGFYRC